MVIGRTLVLDARRANVRPTLEGLLGAVSQVRLARDVETQGRDASTVVTESGPAIAGREAPRSPRHLTRAATGAVEQVTARRLALAEWVDHVVELSRSGGAAFQRAEIADHLAETFECHVTWNWAEPDGSFGFEVQGPLPGDLRLLEADGWAVEAMRRHPLLVWFAHTGDPTPMTAGRVPREVVPPRGRVFLTEALGPHDCDQQLSIPYRLGGTSYGAFVLAQPRVDFADEQLDLARRLQPLLTVLDRQADVVTRRACPEAARGEVNLTCREAAVLGLLAEGLTAAAIGSRLLVSPRTVHTHLDHIYRKLGVRDRMMAVLTARELGVLETGAGEAGAGGAPLAGPSFTWPGPPVFGPVEGAQVSG